MPGNDLFISDLHLSPHYLQSVQLFEKFIKQLAPRAQRLYILGDFFEVWYGDSPLSSFANHIASLLAGLKQEGTEVFLMHGNRDFLLGEKFCHQADCTLINDPTYISFGSRKILLTHGDLLSQDPAYHRFYRFVRNPLVKNTYLKLPASIREKIANRIRQESKRKALISDVCQATVKQWLAKHQANVMIHGHTHRPGIHSIQHAGKTCSRYVLGDWHSDAYYLEMHNEKLSLKNYCFTSKD